MTAFFGEGMATSPSSQGAGLNTLIPSNLSSQVLACRHESGKPFCLLHLQSIVSQVSRPRDIEEGREIHNKRIMDLLLSKRDYFDQKISFLWSFSFSSKQSQKKNLFSQRFKLLGGKRQAMRRCQMGEKIPFPRCEAMWRHMRRQKSEGRVGVLSSCDSGVEAASGGREGSDGAQLSSGPSNLAVNWDLTRPTWSGQ